MYSDTRMLGKIVVHSLLFSAHIPCSDNLDKCADFCGATAWLFRSCSCSCIPAATSTACRRRSCYDLVSPEKEVNHEHPCARHQDSSPKPYVISNIAMPFAASSFCLHYSISCSYPCVDVCVPVLAGGSAKCRGLMSWSTSAQALEAMAICNHTTMNPGGEIGSGSDSDCLIVILAASLLAMLAYFQHRCSVPFDFKNSFFFFFS